MTPQIEQARTKYPQEMWVKQQGCKLSPKQTSIMLYLCDIIMDKKLKVRRNID